MSTFALSAVIMLSQARVPSMNHNMPQCRFFTDALFSCLHTHSSVNMSEQIVKKMRKKI